MSDPLVAIVREQIPELPSAPSTETSRKLNLLERNRLLGLAPKPQPLPDPDGGPPELDPRRRLVLVSPAPVLEATALYQWTPFIKCAKANASVVGALSGASSPLPLAACDSGNSLYAVLRILSLNVGATL